MTYKRSCIPHSHPWGYWGRQSSGLKQTLANSVTVNFEQGKRYLLKFLFLTISGDIVPFRIRVSTTGSQVDGGGFDLSYIQRGCGQGA